MAIEGALQDVSLPDILQLLAMGRKTGCLTLTDRSNFGYIYLKHGRIVHASVLNRPDRLGELLVRNGAISREELSRAMDEQAGNRGVRLGELLVESGSLDEAVLGRFVRLQIEEAVYHLFTWSQGTFHFDADQTPDASDRFLTDLPAENLLLEGARRVDEWSQIEKKISSFDLVFSLSRNPEDDPDVELTEHQRRVLPLLDGRRTVDDLVLESGLVEFDVGKALFGLIQAGFVERSGTGAVAAREGDAEIDEHLSLGIAFYRSGMLEDAARELGQVVEKDPGHAPALHRLALIAFRNRRFSSALEQFDRIPEPERDRYAVLRNRALTLEMLQRFDEALATLDRAAALKPGDPEVALARGIVLLRMGDSGPALEALRAYRTSPAVRKPAPLYYAFAVVAAAMDGQMEHAVAVGREGLGHYPESAPVLVNTGAVLEHRGETQAAAALYARAVARYPAPAQAHKALGDQAFARGEMERARVHYERAVKADPRLGDDVYLRLGNIAHADADLDVARLLWRRALELNPSNHDVQERLEGLEAGTA
jgi:tetratricopeptide (TPR) repeat protein